MPPRDDAFVGTLTDHHGAFFKVLHTTRRSQTAVMTVPAGQEAGPPEVHPEADQVIHVVEGDALLRLWTRGRDAEPEERACPPGTVLVVPAGMRHWVKSVGRRPLLFLTVYAPPEY